MVEPRGDFAPNPNALYSQPGGHAAFANLWPYASSLPWVATDADKILLILMGRYYIMASYLVARKPRAYPGKPAFYSPCTEGCTRYLFAEGLEVTA